MGPLRSRRLGLITWVVLCATWDPPSSGPLFQYNRQRQQWERIIQSEAAGTSSLTNSLGTHIDLSQARIDELVAHLDEVPGNMQRVGSILTAGRGNRGGQGRGKGYRRIPHRQP